MRTVLWSSKKDMAVSLLCHHSFTPQLQKSSFDSPFCENVRVTCIHLLWEISCFSLPQRVQDTKVYKILGLVHAGVEVFLFHWGCTRLRSMGNDQRSPTVCARGGTESLLPLLDNFSGNSRADLFLGMRRCVPPGMKSPRHTGN